MLRQYPEGDVLPAWQRMQDQLGPDGVILDGTCDELGRRGSWVLLDADRPVSLTLFSRPDAISRPSDVADRLVKALIHRNVAGEPIHALLQAMDAGLGPARPAGHLRPPAALGGDVRDRCRGLAGALDGRPGTGPAS